VKHYLIVSSYTDGGDLHVIGSTDADSREEAWEQTRHDIAHGYLQAGDFTDLQFVETVDDSPYGPYGPHYDIAWASEENGEEEGG
jgi:hypothetical protein